jgi:ribosomal protein S18 acetylase RimI-like enzyme
MSERTWTLRSLTELDLDDLIGIVERTTGRYQPDLWEGRVTYYLRRDPETSVVAEEGGRVVGFVLADVRRGEFGLEEPSGWIEVLGVEPEHRGSGLGRSLLEELFSRLKARGVTVIRTLVDRSMPELEGFFRKMGFAEDTLRPFSLHLEG